MKKSTKGAVAASVAALLLIGTWGTQASWSDDEEVPGTALDTGHLKLVNATCDGWLIGIDLSDPNPVTFNPAALKLTPGNVLTQVCTFEVDAVGLNLKATLGVATPQLSGAGGLVSALNVTADYEDENGDPILPTVELNDGDVITATLRVTLPDSATNAVQDLSATLADITVTASQA